jgi:hypothetical protein
MAVSVPEMAKAIVPIISNTENNIFDSNLIFKFICPAAI